MFTGLNALSLCRSLAGHSFSPPPPPPSLNFPPSFSPPRGTSFTSYPPLLPLHSLLPSLSPSIQTSSPFSFPSPSLPYQPSTCLFPPPLPLLNLPPPPQPPHTTTLPPTTIRLPPSLKHVVVVGWLVGWFQLGIISIPHSVRIYSTYIHSSRVRHKTEILPFVLLSPRNSPHHPIPFGI